jgi:hypothetical protein
MHHQKKSTNAKLEGPLNTQVMAVGAVQTIQPTNKLDHHRKQESGQRHEKEKEIS